MEKQYFTNNGVSTLATAANADAKVLTLASGSGGLFPALLKGGFFDLTLSGLDANGNENRWEIVRVTARTGDVLTVQRGQENTAVRAWPAGSRAELRLTAAVLNRVESRVRQGALPDAVAYEYNENGLPEKCTEQVGADQRVTTYTYASGLPETAITRWQGIKRTETYHYDAAGLPVSVQVTEGEDA